MMLKAKDFVDYRVVEEIRTPLQLVYFLERFNYGGEVQQQDSPTMADIGPSCETIRVVRRPPDDDVIALQEPCVVIFPALSMDTVQPLQVRPDVWRWAFHDSDGSGAFQVTPAGPVKIIFVTSLEGNSVGIIKGPASLLLLLAQQKYPLDTITGADVKALEAAWEQWWGYVLRASKLDGKGYPVMLVDTGHYEELLRAFEDKLPAAEVLGKFVEEAWQFDLEGGMRPGVPVTAKFAWRPVYIRDETTRSLLAAWKITPRIERTTTAYGHFRVNVRREELLPETRPSVGWRNLRTTLCRAPVDTALPEFPPKPVLVGAFGRPVVDFSIASTFVQYKYKREFPVQSYGEAPAWFRGDGMHVVMRVGGTAGDGDLQNFLDLCTPHGFPVDIYYTQWTPGYFEGSLAFVQEEPAGIIKGAVDAWVGAEKGMLLRLAQSLVWARNQASLGVDMVFPGLLNNEFTSKATQSLEYIEQADKFYTHLPYSRAEFQARKVTWHPVFEGAPEALRAFKNLAIMQVTGKRMHPVSHVLAVQELDALADTIPDLQDLLDNFFASEGEDDDDEDWRPAKDEEE